MTGAERADEWHDRRLRRGGHGGQWCNPVALFHGESSRAQFLHERHTEVETEPVDEEHAGTPVTGYGCVLHHVRWSRPSDQFLKPPRTRIRPGFVKISRDLCDEVVVGWRHGQRDRVEQSAVASPAIIP